MRVRFKQRKTLLTLLCALALADRARAFEPVAARHGMVVSAEPQASDVGLEILEAGGNAVDAAVAVGFALAVTHPYAGNIGGGGFMLVRMATGEAGEAIVVDYREEAPAAASRIMYLDAKGDLAPEASVVGARAVGVPGTVAGLALVEEKYGKLGLARALAPAIRLAEQGFPVSYALSQSLQGGQALLSRFDGSRRIFLRNGKLYEPGEIFKQPELAHTLRLIAQGGPDAFYRGAVAKAIASTMEKYGGLITLGDLEQYQAKVRAPLEGRFRGFTVLTVPPPSSGGVALIEMLNVLEPLDLGSPNSYQSIHVMAETMRRAYADRAAYLGDGDFVSVPVAGLTSPKYAAKLREEILNSKPKAPVVAGGPAAWSEGTQTTHFSVVDADGNAVANTYTLNGGYGSGVTVEGAGFLLNDEMDDFASKPGAPNMFGLVQGEANAIQPRKRPLSSMTPTIVLGNNRDSGFGIRDSGNRIPNPGLRLVLGSPGGGTIINTVLQVLLNVLVFKMDVREAVTAPRFHHQWMPDELLVEDWGFSADTLERLKEAGYKVNVRGGIGECQAIAIDPETRWRFGAADPRGDGKAVGY
ncbi:MAG: gamma-glutamyltransferase [Acidobacteria bacterium]|nr:MAG: gamma-glutamyltransferase [Acidobacteriota bacterium]